MGVHRGYILTDETSDVKKLRPIFTGRTEEGHEISLYQHADREEELHILLPPGLMNDTGGLMELPSESSVSTWYDPHSYEMRIDVISDVWTGQASGTKWELMRTDSR